MQCLEDIITLTLLILQVLLEHRSNIDVLTWAMSMSACLLGMATDMFFCWNTQFSSVQSLSRVRLFVTPWMAACQASLSITDSRSLLKLMPIKSVMPSSHLILCSPPLSSCPQSLPASGSFPMSQLFAWGGQSTEVSASASVLPMNTQDWSPCSPGDSQESSPTPQFKSILILVKLGISLLYVMFGKDLPELHLFTYSIFLSFLFFFVFLLI